MSIHIIALLDDRPGNRSQVEGVALALEEQLAADSGTATISRLEFGFTKLGTLPNIFRGAWLPGTTPAANQLLQQILTADAGNGPHILISAGRRSAPLSRWLKKRLSNAINCHLMWPETGIKDFDLIALPLHDQEKYGGDNVLFTLGAPGKIRPAAIAQDRIAARQYFAEQHPNLSPPYTSVLIGGESRHGAFTLEHATTLGNQLHELQKAVGGSLLISTSRRTGEAQTNGLAAALQDTPHFLHQWGMPENPYRNMLAAADTLVVTEDSVSMLSEALITGKPLYLFQFGLTAPFTALHRKLLGDGIISPVQEPFVAKQYVPIIPADVVASELVKKFI